MLMRILLLFFFFFNDTATTEIYTLSLHDALPISNAWDRKGDRSRPEFRNPKFRSEEHTSELQSRVDLVCRLLLEKKKQKNIICYKTKKKKTSNQKSNIKTK